MQYATKASRIGAFLIDDVVLFVISFLAGFISYGLCLIVSAVGGLLYFGIMEGSSMHGTFGKYLMGIAVVDENGQPLDYGKSFTRSILRILSGSIFGIGFLLGLFDEEGKTLHDRLARTRIVLRSSVGQSAAVYGNRAVHQEVPQPVKQADGVQPKLIGVAGGYAGQAYLIGPQGLMMGRDQNACDFVFHGNAAGISRTHCKVQYNPQTGMFVLYDLGSSYGTYLANGVRIPQGQPMALRPGEQFYLADRGCTFMVNL